MSTLILFTLLAILLSAYFSGMEIAFISSNKLLFEVDKKSRGITSRIISFFYSNGNNYISTILVGNNIVVVIYGILMADLLSTTLLSGMQNSAWLQLLTETVLSTIVIIIAGEFIPKTLFRIDPNYTLKLFAFPTFLFYICLYPISRFATALSLLILRMAGIKISKEDSEKTFSKTELDYLVQNSLNRSENNDEQNNDVKIFQNVLDFSEIKVRDCYIPRTEIDSISIEAGVEQLKSLFIESGHSKIIVYQDDIDHIVGYIHSSQLFNNADEWKKQICTMPIVPETLPAQKMMKILMQQKKSLAVVVNEFGGTSGIISLEDIVEEIFGDIEDEHDNNTYIAEQESPNDYLLSARLEIEKINELFPLNLPESEEYQTLGGLILYYHQSFPKINETVKIGRKSFKIIRCSSSKLDLIRITVEE